MSPKAKWKQSRNLSFLDTWPGYLSVWAGLLGVLGLIAFGVSTRIVPKLRADLRHAVHQDVTTWLAVHQLSPCDTQPNRQTTRIETSPKTEEEEVPHAR